MDVRDSTNLRDDPALIAARLGREFGYSPTSAASAAQRLIGCSQTIWEPFKIWWQTGELGSLEVEGISVVDLVRDYALRTPGAFLMLDWLLNDPSAAKAALARGYDSVGHGPERSAR